MPEFRILHTETSYGLGGQEFRIVSEAKGMAFRGHQVVLAAPAHSELAKLASKEGIPCEVIPVGFGGWPRLVPLFLRLIARHRIQFVHTHGSQDSWTASVAGRLSSQRPIIIRARHKSTSISSSLRHDVLYRRLPHAVITTGEYVRRQLITQNRLDPSHVYSIPTGVDLYHFRPCSRNRCLKGSFGFSGEDPLVGTVTFLRPEKGIHILIEAVGLLQNEFPRLRCLIVGTGSEYQNLLRQTHEQQLESTVVFTGLRQDIPDLLSLMDVFVLPSLEEGMPQSLTQALAMQCPVVASEVGAVPEAVRDGQTGLLVPARNPQVLSEKMAFLLRHPDQGRRMGEAGRLMIEREYSLDAMLRKTEQVYAQLWEKRKGRAA